MPPEGSKSLLAAHIPHRERQPRHRRDRLDVEADGRYRLNGLTALQFVQDRGLTCWKVRSNRIYKPGVYDSAPRYAFKLGSHFMIVCVSSHCSHTTTWNNIYLS